MAQVPQSGQLSRQLQLHSQQVMCHQRQLLRQLLIGELPSLRLAAKSVHAEHRETP